MKYNIKYTKEQLEKVVKNSLSVTGVLRFLGLPISGGYHAHISKKIKYFNIDISHFTGQGWNVGGKMPFGPKKLKASEILVYDRNHGRRENVKKLARALREMNVREQCNCCGLEKEWNNKPLVLQINHKDGNFVNNLLGNLEYLCPNCHSQTDTFGTKNIER